MIVEINLIARVVQPPAIAGEVSPCWFNVTVGTGRLDFAHNAQLLAQPLLGAFEMKPYFIRRNFGVAGVTQQRE